MLEWAYLVVLVVWTLVKPSQLPQFSTRTGPAVDDDLNRLATIQGSHADWCRLLTMFGKPLEMYSAEEYLVRKCVGKGKTYIKKLDAKG